MPAVPTQPHAQGNGFGTTVGHVYDLPNRAEIGFPAKFA
jgi:hypothetical protein